MNKKNAAEVLPEDYANYDLSFKIIVIGNSGKNKIFLIYNIFIIIKYYRSREILFIYASNKK